MIYLDDVICLKYTTLVRNPRYGSDCFLIHLSNMRWYSVCFGDHRLMIDRAHEEVTVTADSVLFVCLLMASLSKDCGQN